MNTATYFDAQNLLYVRCSAHLHFASLTARIAEWIITIDAPRDRKVLVDLRQLHTVDRPIDGSVEYVQMQRKLAHEFPPASKLALLAPRPEVFVLARIFEQSAQDHITTEIDVFRNDAEALAFLGLPAEDVDDFVEVLGKGQRLD